MKYDVAYQDWLRAKQKGDFSEADRIRDIFECKHGLTIFAEGEMPVEGLTVRRMKLSAWYRKYGNDSKLTEAIQTNESRFGVMYK